MAGQLIDCPLCNAAIEIPLHSHSPAVRPKSPYAPRAPITELSPKVTPREYSEHTNPHRLQPFFLYIPISRLIILSIASFGLYEMYWMYRNWRYIKERHILNISPFWRGWFGIIFCYNLLRTIYRDKAARSILEPSFSPGWLATGWIVFFMISYIIGQADELLASAISAFVPSFLFLAPVQKYINTVEERRNSGQYYKWSSGHIVCLVFGVVFWALLLIGIGAELAK